MSRHSVIAAISFALLQLACWLYHSGADLENPKARFVDDATGQDVAKVLVLARWETLTGWTNLLPPHEELELGWRRTCLGPPVFLSAGSPLVLGERHLRLFTALPPGMVGRFEFARGARVVAPGYRSTFLDGEILRSPQPIRLVALSEADVAADSAELLRALEAETLAGADQALFWPWHDRDPRPDEVLDVCLSREERAEIRSFLGVTATTNAVP